MNGIFELILQVVIVLLIIAAAFFSVQAFAQSDCTTYYDHNTGRYCRVCPGPGGVGTVVCY